MHKALERREAYDAAPRPAALEPNHAAAKIKDHESRQHAEYGDPANPAQRDVAELAPIAAGWLLEDARALVGNADAPLNPVELLQKLLLLH